MVVRRSKGKEDTTIYCQCGCGGKTKTITRNNARRGEVKGQFCQFIHNHNGRLRQGSLNPAWKGGRLITKDGYVVVLVHGHPRADPKGYVYEHILAMEKALGRPILPTEAIHHFDEIRHHNDPGNLMLFKTNAMHLAFHRRLRASLKEVRS